MPTLKEDIKLQSEWIVKAFQPNNAILDYTIDSIIELDRFFEENMEHGRPITDSPLGQEGVGHVLFSIGAYLGETIVKNVEGAEWVTDDNDPKGELNVSLKLPDGGEIWPVQKVMKRFQNGSEDALYPYVHMVTKEFVNQPFNERFWSLTATPDTETEGVKRKAYLEGMKLKNSGLDEEAIYARLEKQGIPDKLARQVAADVMLEIEKKELEGNKTFYNVALIRIGLGVGVALISILVFPGKLFLPVGFIAGGVIAAIMAKRKGF